MSAAARQRDLIPGGILDEPHTARMHEMNEFHMEAMKHLAQRMVNTSSAARARDIVESGGDVPPRPCVFPPDDFTDAVYVLLRRRHEIRLVMAYLEPLRLGGIPKNVLRDEDEFLSRMRDAGLNYHPDAGIYRFCTKEDMEGMALAERKRYESAKLRGEVAEQQYLDQVEADNVDSRIEFCIQNPDDAQGIYALITDYIAVTIKTEGTQLSWSFRLLH